MERSITRAGYEPVPTSSAQQASRQWWDAEAQDYLAEHGDFLRDVALVWGPEGLIEDDAALLGKLTGLDVLEVGCGAAHGARWAQQQGARAVGIDLSFGMIHAGKVLGAKTGITPSLIQADATALPLADQSIDLAFSAFGAVPFVPELEKLHREVGRVLRPGGRWVWSTTHPIRWAFPDAPGEVGLTVSRSYFDRTPYAEHSEGNSVHYVEYHRTLGDHLRALRTAGFILDDLIEPEWPESNTETWGGWSPLRGKVLPGTAIFSCRTSKN